MDSMERAIRALVQPAEIQTKLCPDFVLVADELALDFEAALYEIEHEESDEVYTKEQLEAIKNLDNHILSMSGEENLRYWINDAIAVFPEWQRVRELARQVLTLKDWSDAPPDDNPNIYIGPQLQ